MSMSKFPCGKAKRMARELGLWYQTNGPAAITYKQHAPSFSIFSQFAEVLWLNVECQLRRLLASQIIKAPSEPKLTTTDISQQNKYCEYKNCLIWFLKSHLLP